LISFNEIDFNFEAKLAGAMLSVCHF